MRPTLAASVIALAALACSGSGSIPPPPPPAPGIAGRVLGSGGQPAPGVEVRVQGRRAVTDAAGTFSVQGVEVPYDLTLFEPPNHAITYQALAARQLPDLHHPGPDPQPSYTPVPSYCGWQARVSGAEALAPDEIIEVFFCDDAAGSCVATLPIVPDHPLAANADCSWDVVTEASISSMEARLARSWDAMAPVLQVQSASRAVTFR